MTGNIHGTPLLKTKPKFNYMKRIILSLSLLLGVVTANAQGWPDNYDGVMLQGFYWDSFNDSKWTKFTKQAPELSHYFKLIWIPQSGFCGGGKSMGYNPLYYFNQNSSFGTEQELRNMIKTLKDNGIGTIGDVVVNHRGTLTNWVDFPAEEYKGVTYQMLSTDICSDDDGGETKKWADANGYKLSNNKDGYEDWSGMRDLDHRSANVNKCIKAYVKYLVDELGYTGFRYDMVKGFAGSYVGEYNVHAGVQYSVGEHWSSASETKNWINSTKYNGIIQSAGFDFQLHYRFADAIKQKNWTTLRTNNEHIIQSGDNYNRYAITFVENHDTQWRSSSSTGSEPILSNILACNAFMLAMPGTPCVFLKHWLDYKNDIKKMIEVRKLVGITNKSTYTFLNTSDRDYVAVFTYGGIDKSKVLLTVVGSNVSKYTPAAAYTKLCEGDGYVFYVNGNVDTSGWQAIIDRIAAEDVPEPEEPFDDRQATIYVNTSLPTGWTSGSVNFWVWSDTDGSNLCNNKTWPGDKITQTKNIDGIKWFYQTYNVTKANHPINIVLSTGTGSIQTVDIEGIENDIYLEVPNGKIGTKYSYKDVTSEHSTGIKDIQADEMETTMPIYNINGQCVGKSTGSLKEGIYVRNGKKFTVR